MNIIVGHKFDCTIVFLKQYNGGESVYCARLSAQVSVAGRKIRLREARNIKQTKTVNGCVQVG